MFAHWLSCALRHSDLAKEDDVRSSQGTQSSGWVNIPLKLHLAEGAEFAVGLPLFVCCLCREIHMQYPAHAPLFRALLPLLYGRVGREAAFTMGSLILLLDVDHCRSC